MAALVAGEHVGAPKDADSAGDALADALAHSSAAQQLGSLFDQL